MCKWSHAKLRVVREGCHVRRQRHVADTLVRVRRISSRLHNKRNTRFSAIPEVWARKMQLQASELLRLIASVCRAKMCESGREGSRLRLKSITMESSEEEDGGERRKGAEMTELEARGETRRRAPQLPPMTTTRSWC